MTHEEKSKLEMKKEQFHIYWYYEITKIKVKAMYL